MNVVANRRLWDWAHEVPLMLMHDASWHNQLILQCLSNSKTPWAIDDEVGDLSGDLLSDRPALNYLRYDVKLDADTLRDLEHPELAAKAKSLRRMSVARNRFDLAVIGKKAAERQVREEHFPAAFDLP